MCSSDLLARRREEIAKEDRVEDDDAALAASVVVYDRCAMEELRTGGHADARAFDERGAASRRFGSVDDGK